MRFIFKCSAGALSSEAGYVVARLSILRLQVPVACAKRFLFQSSFWSLPNRSLQMCTLEARFCTLTTWQLLWMTKFWTCRALHASKISWKLELLWKAKWLWSNGEPNSIAWCLTKRKSKLKPMASRAWTNHNDSIRQESKDLLQIKLSERFIRLALPQLLREG